MLAGAMVAGGSGSEKDSLKSPITSEAATVEGVMFAKRREGVPFFRAAVPLVVLGRFLVGVSSPRSFSLQS